MKKIINIILISAIIFLSANIAKAAWGGDWGGDVWTLSGSVVNLVNSAWELGSSSVKIAAGYFTNLYADNATIGTLLISSSADGPLIVGTSTNPFIRIAGDTNTGISTTAYDSLGIMTGGTDRLVIGNNLSTFSNSLRASSTLMVTGATTLHNTLNISGLTTLGNASTTLLSVSGTEYIGGANGLVLSDGSILDASGAISFGNENLTTTGTFSGLDLTSTSGFRVGTGSTGGHITALGDDTLFVEGQSEFDGTAWFDGSLRASSTLMVTGNTTLSGDLLTGAIEPYNDDPGYVQIWDLRAGNSVDGTIQGGFIGVDSHQLLQAFGQSTGAATVDNLVLGIYNDTATSTPYIYSGAAGKGGRVILEDSDGAGCTECYALNGALTCAIVTCPTTP